MKHILKITLLAAIVVCGTGCATGYWIDRGRDTADVFTMTAGYGAGGRVQVGPLFTGACYYSDSFGIRSGDVGSFVGTKTYGDSPFNADVCLVFVASDRFETDETQVRGKTIHAATTSVELIPFILPVPVPFWELQDKRSTSTSMAYFSQLEVTVALGGGVRLGFNPGEFIDLLFGFVGIDIYSDDLERRKNMSKKFKSDRQKKDD